MKGHLLARLRDWLARGSALDALDDPGARRDCPGAAACPAPAREDDAAASPAAPNALGRRHD